MSLQKAAKYLESKGRNGDSMLVHMTPGEVKGLQALALAHGGSLSINPHTGLPEASFLKNILPVIAGAALNYFLPGVGTAIGSSLGGLSGAAGTGILVGGAEALRTGDIGRGVTAGLGGFGGAGLAGTGAGTIGAGTSGAGTSGGVGISAGAPTSAGAGTSVTPGASGYLGTGGTQLATGINPTATPGITSSTSLYTPNITPSGSEGMGKYLMAAAAPTLSDAMTPKVPGAPTEEEDPRYKGSPYNYRLASDFRGYAPTTPNPYYRPTGLGYAAQGGSTTDIMMSAGGSYDDEPRGDDQGFGFAAGGQLGGYSDGGRMLKGPGDGMSDSIPGVIGNKQPARLADGEFVVPADVVSHLGNGSTDAGAKRLYGMMDKVRKARTGTKKQGKQIKPEKYMPA